MLGTQVHLPQLPGDPHRFVEMAGLEPAYPDRRSYDHRLGTPPCEDVDEATLYTSVNGVDDRLRSCTGCPRCFSGIAVYWFQHIHKKVSSGIEPVQPRS